MNLSTTLIIEKQIVLPGFKSRWKYPFLCMWASPWSTWDIKFRISSSENDLCCSLINWYRLYSLQEEFQKQAIVSWWTVIYWFIQVSVSKHKIPTLAKNNWVIMSTAWKMMIRTRSFASQEKHGLQQAKLEENDSCSRSYWIGIKN